MLYAFEVADLHADRIMSAGLLGIPDFCGTSWTAYMQETGFCIKLVTKDGSQDSSSRAEVLVCLSADEVVWYTKVG